MRRRELSERIERGEELMELNRRELELNRAAAERNTQAFGRLMEAFDRHEKEFERMPVALNAQDARADDLRTFIREMNLKSEKLFQELYRRSDETMAEQRRKTDTILAQLKDVREESKAQTQALLAVLDRLPPPAQAA
jgi:hypothetical protein